MKNFLLAAAYLAGMAWWAGEGMVRAAAGSWWVILLFFAVLSYVIVRIGCLNADKKTADQTGALFTAITTVMLLVLTGLSFAGGAEGADDGNGTAILKLVLALAFGLIAFFGWRGSTASAHAH